MPATIDRTAYPSIIDLIIEYAPVGALVALRSTSRAFRARLPLHAQLELKESQSKHSPFFLTDPSGAQLPDDAYLEGVRVVDIITPGTLPFTKRTECRNRLYSTPTVRRMNGAYTDFVGQLPEAHTLVDFVRVPGHPPCTPSLDLRDVIRTYVTSGATRYVLHIDLDDTWAADPIPSYREVEAYNLDWDSLREVVFVFWLPRGEMMNQWLVYKAAGRAVTRWHDTTRLSVTIVGLERAADPPTIDTVYCALTTAICLPPYLNYSREIRSALRMLTIEEWWEELGDRKEIEGVWPWSATDHGSPTCRPVLVHGG
ncbi:hypothetical protein Q8F55_002912 [Vanrija albida]|uniref:F-box domain-containing protein n=1 Tax=Vanrija albida TaxID=181172 RepID=A0ABR3QB26_9TREE